MVQPSRSPQPIEPVALDFRATYERWFGPVWRTLRRLGVREADLEDTVQEVFMVFHRRLNDFDHACPVGPWLMGIAHRVAAAERRRARHRRELPTASDQLENRPGSVKSPQEDVEAIQRRKRVQEALDALYILTCFARLLA